MKPVTQTRTGDRGNCFASCLASIFETPLPEFGLTEDEGYDANVDKWLAKRGWQYSQTEDTSTPPIGYHTIEGVSPRGGMHATVGLNGKMVWDPHPEDGTGHGLVKVVRYGLLTPLGARDSKEFRQRVEQTKGIREPQGRSAWYVPSSAFGLTRQKRPDVKSVTQYEKKRVPLDKVKSRQTYLDRNGLLSLDKLTTAELQSKTGSIAFLQVGDDYFIMDGHHRCAVLKSRNVKYIDALVKQGSRAKDSVTLRPDRDGEYALQYDAEPVATSKFIPGIGFHGGKVSKDSGHVVVKLDGKRIGAAGVKYEGGVWRITTLAVEPSLIGKGYGKYLYSEIVKQAAENDVKELRSCSETNRSPGSEHAWNRLAETHGAVKENGTWRVKAKDTVLPIPLKGP
jgi:GNAT superfamily N-acetyltransferase